MVYFKAKNLGRTNYPILPHKETGELHPDTVSSMEKVAQLMEESGIDAWFETDASELISDAENYDKTTDVLDVWF